MIKGFELKFEPSSSEQEEFLNLGYIRQPFTGYKNLINLSAACHLTIANGEIKNRSKYWMLPEPFIGKGRTTPISDGEIDIIRDILCDSVQKRLISDVRVGLFLSGGVDSSLIASLLTRELNSSIEAFTVSPTEIYGVDEGDIAKKIAKELGIAHTTLHLDNENSVKTLPDELSKLFGVPNDNITSIAVNLMCRELRHKIKVAICGLGGDEIFYGYNKYWSAYRFRYFYRFPKFFSLLSSMAKSFFPRAQLLHEMTKGDIDRRYLNLKNMGYKKTLERLTNNNTPTGMLSTKQEDFVFKVRDYDLRYSLVQSHIPAAERGSMHASLEVRSPYLSRKLLEFVSTLDQRSLIAYGKKNVLRRLLSRYINPDLLLQAKQGFIFPAGKYFRTPNIDSPLIEGLQNDELERLWSDRANPLNQQLLIRVALLNHYYN